VEVLKLIWDDKRITGSVDLPYSKSHFNRLLILKKLFANNIQLPTIPGSNDTDVLIDLLENNYPKGECHEIDVQDAGTVYRFMLPYFCMMGGEYLIRGSQRLMNRPIDPLIDTLSDMGFDISRSAPPEMAIYIKSNGISDLQKSHWKIDVSKSSQFASALLLIAPLSKMPITIELLGNAVSSGYLTMTIKTMEHMGFDINHLNNSIQIGTKAINEVTHVEVEKDWSSASYFIALACLSPTSRIKIRGLIKSGLQPDEAILDMADFYHLKYTVEGNDILFENTDLPTNDRAVNRDYTTCPDIALTEIVAHKIKNTQLNYTGTAHLAFKESDRITNIQNELMRFVSVKNDLVLKTHNDHRMAMSLALLSFIKPICIENPDVVNKSFADFWQQLEGLGLKTEIISKPHGQ